MPADFELKRGDRRPSFSVILEDNFGAPGQAVVDLTAATSATFSMWDHRSHVVKVNRGTASIAGTAVPGQVSYAWGTADVSTAGIYDAEVEVLWNDGKAETFPSGGYWTVLITEDID
jgi:hypothetical protein